MYTILASMASSSSSSSSIHIKSGPIEEDVLWLQPKHVSEHVWNGEADRKLHIRRAVPIYQGQEEIPEEIIPLLCQSGFYWIMKMGYLKINSSLITALIERWRPETHTFHLRCGEATITLQDVSVLLGLHTEGAPLIGQTNLDWAELCEELLGVRPQEGELQGSVVKLSWLAHHFSEINIHDGNVEQLQRFTRGWILRFIGGVLFVDKSSSKVSLRYLQFLQDFEQCRTYAWGPARDVQRHRLQNKINRRYVYLNPIVGMRTLHDLSSKENSSYNRKQTTRTQFLWEPYTATVMSMLPPICLVGSMSWCAVVPLICFHVVEWHQPDRVLRQFGMQQPIPESPSQPWNVHGLTLKGKMDENWFQLLAPFISQWNNQVEFRVDVYARQEGLLSFNLDYMVWYRRKTKMFIDPNNANTATLGEVTETLQYMVSPQGRNTWTIDDLVPYVEKLAILSQEQERITEPVAHGPAPERRFPPQQFHMLQSSVETRGFDRRREIVQAEDFSQHMEQRGHGMYYTPPTFAQYPLQMYQYPFEGHDTDMSASEHSFGGVAETQPHFSWPTMTPSQQHDAPMATPNAPLGQQWDVPGAIPAMGDLLGVDLRHEFSAEVEEQGRRQRARRNPDRQARRWDRPCGTSSHHHGHHDD
ncbi:Serine/threonine-protein phosphatase 7 long form [Glycine soja]